MKKKWLKTKVREMWMRPNLWKRIGRFMVGLELCEEWKGVSLSVLCSFVLVRDSCSSSTEYLLSRTAYKIGSLLTQLWLISIMAVELTRLRVCIRAAFQPVSQVPCTAAHHSSQGGGPAEELQLTNMSIWFHNLRGFCSTYATHIPSFLRQHSFLSEGHLRVF